MLTLLILLQMTENVISEESPIVPRSNSFFEVTNWTTLLKLDANQTTMSAKLFEIDNNRENTLIGEVVDGNLYNNLQDHSHYTFNQKKYKKENNTRGGFKPGVWGSILLQTYKGGL